jgi:glycosyltransferase involved in cell wall biosynthesis
MTARPLVSVVLPCYDVERTVGRTIESLLGQTYETLEVIAIDDGSSDATATILERFAVGDPRIRLLRNGANRGLIFTLNRGVAEARGAFIARIDADSRATPERLERQLAAFARRPEVGVVGTAVELVDVNGRRTVKPRPVRCTEPDAARFMALFANPMAHVTIMARAELMKTYPYGTSPDSLHTEDYEVYTRMLEGGVSFLNLRDVLVTVEDRPEGVSWRHEPEQVANFVSCSRRYLERTLHLSPLPGVHKALVNRIDRTITAEELREGLHLLDQIESEYRSTAPGAVSEIRDIADLQRADILVQAGLKGGPRTRIAAAQLALRYYRAMLSPRVRKHLIAKLPRARTSHSGSPSRERPG